MKRYMKVLWIIIKINSSTMLAYRANFYNSALITVGWGVISIVSIVLLTSKTPHVYGWTRQELYLLTGIYSIIIGIFHMFFSSSFERFARTISIGELDSYLLQPLDIQFFLSIKTFRPLTFLRICIGTAFTVYMLQVMHTVINLLLVSFFILFIFCGVILLYAIWFLIITLTIWYPTLTNLVDFLYQISNLGRYPPSLILYTKNIIVFLLIPLTLVASVPARFVLGKVSALEIVGLVGVTLGLFIVSRLFWQFALKHYTSASS